MRLVMLGPPGAGKGTQATAIVERFGIPHVSTGGMLRQAISGGTTLGLKAKEIVASGNLVPDDLMAEMIRVRLAAQDAGDGFLLDGYPRNRSQGETLDGILSAMGRTLDHVIYMTLADEQIIKRLSGREAIERRSDDRPEVIAQRLEIYRNQTAPLVGFYRDKGLLREVDADGSVEEVGARIVAALEAKTVDSPAGPSSRS